MSLRRMIRGQPLDIPADGWNRIVDAVISAERAKRFGGDRLRRAFPSGAASVRNMTGAQLDRMSIVQIVGATVEPHTRIGEFVSNISFRADVPSGQDDAIAVVIDPIPIAGVGPAIVAGIAAARVRMMDEEHRFAATTDGQTAHLVSSDEGPVQLLTIQNVDDRDDPEIAVCYVALHALVVVSA